MELAAEIAALMKAMPPEQAIDVLNDVSATVSAASPAADQPLSRVRWVPLKSLHPSPHAVGAIDPRKRALLKRSVSGEGMLAPLVTAGDAIIDGAHRAAVISSDKKLRIRSFGFVPTVAIDRPSPEHRAIAHRLNTARGRPAIEREAAVFKSMVADGWSLEKIATEFGYEADFVIRLTQITRGDGVLALYADRDFGRAHTMVDFDE